MVTPGEYYGKAPFGSANAVKWAVSRPFLQGNRAYDYGVIHLSTDPMVTQAQPPAAGGTLGG